MALMLDANKDAKLSPDDMQRLRAQVLRNLIDETLQIQAAKTQDIEPKPDDVAAQYGRVAANNGKSPEELADYLAKIGSSKASIMRQIEGEIAWHNLLQRNVTPFISVSADEVNEMMDRLKASKGTAEYRVGEIYLAATPENAQAVFDNGKRIVDQLKQGGNFASYARQFSQASTAAVGGDLGWIRLPQLPKELADAVTQLQAGQLVGPVQVPGGFSIVYLIDKRQVLTADPRDAILSLKQISITFPKDATDDQKQAKLADFVSRVQQIRGCGDVEAVAPLMGADVISNGQVPARQLPSELQDVLLNLQVGQATPPFRSDADGVRVLMLCGRDDPKSANDPNFDQLMNQLEDERIDRRAQSYLRDLRNDAIIEYN
jgi:peptidyl-prolyl cis-trans isomerase SurA